jgi:hypothetical protein
MIKRQDITFEIQREMNSFRAKARQKKIEALGKTAANISASIARERI